MATSALFAEILVIGIITDLWIGLTILAVASPSREAVSSLIDKLDKVDTLLVFPLLALTYALGWAINFATERIFKLLFQEKIRDHLCKARGVDYDDARALFFHKASETVLGEWHFDRHIIRISRSNTFNFLLLGVALLLHLSTNEPAIIAGFVLCLAIAATSLLQWMNRTRVSCERMLKTYGLIIEGLAEGQKTRAV